MRLMFGLVGIASISAFTAAMVPSIAPAPVADAAAAAADVTTADAVVPVEAAPVRHVTRYVTLQPGQTPPPGAAVNVQPTPTPILKTQVVVKPRPKPKAVTRSRQSGQP
jgi:ABC-type Fe3+-hydroxamate transport system substrate-binding protein